MNLPMTALTETCEIQRLEALLPSELRSRTVVVRSTKANSALIATERVSKNRYTIQIDLVRWHQLSVDQRNLLVWHEASRIYHRSVIRFSWEMLVISAGLSMALVEISTQNLLSLAIALVVVGLAGNQLYQRNQGERGLKQAAVADQGAIDLAIQFGYSCSQAHENLRDALTILSKQTAKKSLWRKYQVRLRVLEIFAAQSSKSSQPIALTKTALSVGVEDLISRPLVAVPFQIRQDSW